MHLVKYLKEENADIIIMILIKKKSIKYLKSTKKIFSDQNFYDLMLIYMHHVLRATLNPFTINRLMFRRC